MDFLKAAYLIETPLPVEDAAAVLAGEQSSGTFVSVPGETAELKQKYAARVESVTPLEDVDSPSLPGCRAGDGPFHRAQVTIAWPAHNFGPNLPTLLSTVGGNLFELSQLSGVKLLDLEFPPSFAHHFRGPAHGVRGTRQATAVEGRPLIGTIIKPSVGLSPDDTAAMVKELCEAGIDFIKDDELMANPPHSPFDQRVDAVMRVINDYADRTGKRVMVAFNITDERDEMLRHYDELAAQQNTCAMLSLNSVGHVAVKEVCDWGMLVIHGHRNGWGMLNRCPTLGMGFAAYQKLWRLAGVDQLHVNGIDNKFWEPDDSVVASIESCLAPMFGEDQVLPVVSSGQWGGQAFETYRRTATVDLLYMAGGGIMAHPGGPASGVRSLQQAWQAAIDGLTLEQAAEKYTDFGQAVEKFAKR